MAVFFKCHRDAGGSGRRISVRVKARDVNRKQVDVAHSDIVPGCPGMR